MSIIILELSLKYVEFINSCIHILINNTLLIRIIYKNIYHR